MAVLIREASRSDVPAIVTLLGAQFADHSITPSAERLADGVTTLVTRPDLGCVLVADDDGTILGTAVMSWIFVLEHGGPGAWLDELYVRPDHRDRGIGAALVRTAIARARSAGAVVIDLEVEAGHERVERLYEREGFAPHARRRWFRRL